ncbi:myosin-3 [Lepeophtheirus salmonis]|nr:myosin heavy chain, muscle-like [Lepeophtheirus salmonis]
MPGNIKLGASNEPDPDPAPFLYVSFDMKRNDQLKPYDAKKSVWCPGEEGGFVEGLLQSDDGKKAVVLVGHEKKVCKSDQVAQVNPPKFEKCEDMSNLTYLNEASVLWNLKSRYIAKMIYTYSGLFCVAVNPYQRYPIYTPTTVKLYLGKRRTEVPPHLFAVSDTAYRNMLSNGSNQSLLITGESGAGKTENTKKVIAYFAMVGAREDKKSKVKVSLEDQIVQTNPILEAFGNAKTARNDNSSRFGKFIRIHFNIQGKLAGCDIETYLLEKSRITFQQEVERSYHIFYQMFQKAVPDLKDACHLSNDIYDYHYVSQGKTSVPSIDDNEDLEFTHDAFNILHFSNEETYNIYKITAAVMHMGEMKFKQKGREEQCEPDAMDKAEKVGDLLGVDPETLIKSFCKPKIKVGTEWVTKGQNIEQSTSSVAGVARGLYDRIFRFLVEKCNLTLVDKSMKKVFFIGVLDIAGFEIFNYNGFEQLCINFCNEKLQQFFNHHMFVLEQEEYLKEGIDWEMVDFGMDLQSCITMFEKPMGILAILEEESLFPKATDKTFEDKLKTNHLGKSSNFTKASTKTDKSAHFAIVHYAGTVSYNLTGWLEKNKDPLNETVVELFKNGSNKLTVHIFADHPGQGSQPHDDAKGKKGGKKAKGGHKTVSSFYKLQLDSLMSTLHATEPHFIRCIVPNGNKAPGEIDSALVLHQLTCNGVLEGIRICMRGFPNRMPFSDFCSRYMILENSKIKSSNMKDPQKITELICTSKIDKEKFRVGHTKIFFRAGVLGYLEEVRDDIVIKLVRFLQGQIFGLLARREYSRKKKQREYLKVIQRNFRKYMRLRNWGWFSIIQKTRPLIGMVNIEEEIKVLEDQAQMAVEEVENEKKVTEALEKENIDLLEKKAALLKRVKLEQGDLSTYQERNAKASAQKADLEAQLIDCQDKLSNEEKKKHQISSQKKSLEKDVNNLRREVSELEEQIIRAENEKASRDHTLRSLNDDITNQDEIISKLNKEKKYIQENNNKIGDDLQVADDKVSHLNMVKSKLEQTMDEMEEALEKEKRYRNDSEKNKRKFETELKVSQEHVADLERSKKESESSLIRREKDILEMNSKLECEQSQAGKLTRNIKELQARVEEWEEELEAERQGRAKSERQRSDLNRELEELTERLEEASGATAAQIELNKKREAEVLRLRKDLEEASIQQEAIILSLKKKHHDAISEMTEQIDQLNKLKSKAENEKMTIKMQTDDLKAAHDHLMAEKASAEKNNKNLQSQNMNINKKIAECSMQLQDLEERNKKLLMGNSELLRCLDDVESNISIMNKSKIELTNQLDDAKRLCDDEAKERQSLLGRYRNLEHEYDGTRAILEEEISAKEDLIRQFKKAENETCHWRLKYEQDGIAKIEELENSKLKLQARLTECEGTLENLNNKMIQLDKAKTKLQKDIEEFGTEVDHANIKNGQIDKKIRQFDKIIIEWKQKTDHLSSELDNSQKECRNVSSELFRVKGGYEEATNQFSEVKKENMNLTDEIKDIMEQINEGGRSIHEIEKQRKRLESEKKELQSALEEAESALESEENKNLRAQMEINQVRQELERRINEKDEEFEMVKKSHIKLAEQMQNSLEAESKAKAETLRSKKKLEADIQELERALEHANITHAENQKNISKYQDNIRSTTLRLEDEHKTKGMMRENLISSDRRTHSLQNSLEEAKTLLEQADRARRAAEHELNDCHESMNDLSVQNQSLAATKRKIQSETDNIKQEVEYMNSEATMAEEKAKNAMMDAAKLAEELRAEQDMTIKIENERKAIEAQVKDLQIRLDEAETNALKNGKKVAQKLETRIRELEGELDGEQRRLTDCVKNLRKNERKIKDLDFQSEEDKKQQLNMQELVDRLQNKIRNFKKQIEEAEEIAAMNLSKFRKAQCELEEAEERADLNEHALSKCRVVGRSNTPSYDSRGGFY